MKRYSAFGLVWLIVLLTACGGIKEETITAQDVIDQFNEYDLGALEVQQGEETEDMLLPTVYQEWLTFNIVEVYPSGGQVFACETREECDILFAYFDAFKVLVGPYLYQSPNGLIVVQLNSGLTIETGDEFKAIVESLP